MLPMCGLQCVLSSSSSLSPSQLASPVFPTVFVYKVLLLLCRLGEISGKSNWTFCCVKSEVLWEQQQQNSSNNNNGNRQGGKGKSCYQQLLCMHLRRNSRAYFSPEILVHFFPGKNFGNRRCVRKGTLLFSFCLFIAFLVLFPFPCVIEYFATRKS